MRILLPLVLLLTLSGKSASVHAQLPTETAPDNKESPYVFPEFLKFNLETPTLGGRQFWGDVLFFRGYRIQHNVLTDHYRLLDPKDVRHAWGSREECQQVLDRIKMDDKLQPMTGKAVVLVHGIIRSSKSFDPISRKITEAGYQVVGFDYPSTRVSLEDSARYLQQTIDSLAGVEQIEIVAHSMGGLLVRTYLQLTQNQRDPRLHRLVMLGVPNRGASLATLFQKNVLFQMVLGPAGQQLIDDPAGFIAKLPALDLEFAVVAGIRGAPDGWNPLIPGEDDGTVSLDSTRLPGASDFIAISSLHSSMMWNPDVMAATLRFLQTGTLRENAAREPIPIPPKP